MGVYLIPLRTLNSLTQQLLSLYIEKYIGMDMDGSYRTIGDMGTMPFSRTLEDWAKFDITNRTKFDACISSGLAIMANQKHMYVPLSKSSRK